MRDASILEIVKRLKGISCKRLLSSILQLVITFLNNLKSVEKFIKRSSCL